MECWMTHGGRSKDHFVNSGNFFSFFSRILLACGDLFEIFWKKTNAKISVIGDLIRQTHLVAKVENERVNYTK